MLISKNNIETINDSAEITAGKYLLSKGFKDIVYEPDGNIPPDFLLDGRIAIEVRRLNQNMSVNGRTRGVTEISIPLKDSFVKLLNSLGPPTSGDSWFVAYRFCGNEEDWASLRIKKQDSIFKEIKACLSSFMSSNKRTPIEFKISNKFKLIIICKADNIESKYFLLGSPDSPKRAFFVLNEIIINLKICIAEKTRKIERFRDRYPEWWLILIDHIGFRGLNRSERDSYYNKYKIEHDLDKVILIDPCNFEIAFEI